MIMCFNPRMMENFKKRKAYKNINVSKLMKSIREEEDEKIIINLINKEENINFKDSNKINALHYAIKFNKSSELIKKLLEKKIDTNLENKFAEIPLSLALESKNEKEIIKLLIKNSANINKLIKKEKYSKKISLFILAISKKKDLEILKLLINKKTDFNLTDDFNNSPLLLAINNNYDFETIKFLIDNKTDLFFTNGMGDNVLLLALKNGVNDLEYFKLFFGNEKFYQEKKVFFENEKIIDNKKSKDKGNLLINKNLNHKENFSLNNDKFFDQKDLEGKSPLVISLEKNLNFEIIEFLSCKFNLSGNDIIKFGDFINIEKLNKLILIKKHLQKEDIFGWKLKDYLKWKKKKKFFHI